MYLVLSISSSFCISLHTSTNTDQGKKKFQQLLEEPISPTEQGPQALPLLPCPATVPSSPTRPACPCPRARATSQAPALGQRDEWAQEPHSLFLSCSAKYLTVWTAFPFTSNLYILKFQKEKICKQKVQWLDRLVVSTGNETGFLLAVESLSCR